MSLFHSFSPVPLYLLFSPQKPLKTVGSLQTCRSSLNWYGTFSAMRFLGPESTIADKLGLEQDNWSKFKVWLPPLLYQSRRLLEIVGVDGCWCFEIFVFQRCLSWNGVLLTLKFQNSNPFRPKWGSFRWATRESGKNAESSFKGWVQRRCIGSPEPLLFVRFSCGSSFEAMADVDANLTSEKPRRSCAFLFFSILCMCLSQKSTGMESKRVVIPSKS